MTIDYDDLCKRLQETSGKAFGSWPWELCLQAKAAIAALREQVATWERRCVEADEDVAKSEAENAALRDELDELAGQLALTVKELFETEDRTEAAKADNAALRKAFFWNYKSRRQRRDAMDAAMREGNGPMPERIALRYEYREGEGMRPALQKVIDDFNLDIRDPFTKLLVALLAGKEGK